MYLIVKSFALLEELLERREAEEQTLAISTLATQLKKCNKNTILQSVALLQTEIEKRLGELIFLYQQMPKKSHFWFAPYFQLSFF